MQIRSTPFCPGLPSPGSIIFNRLVGGLLTRINRLLMMYDYDEENHNLSKLRQNKLTKYNDTLKDPISLCVGSTVAMQREDGGPRTHGTITEHSNKDHDGWSYKMHITKTWQTVTRTTRNSKQHQLSRTTFEGTIVRKLMGMDEQMMIYIDSMDETYRKSHLIPMHLVPEWKIHYPNMNMLITQILTTQCTGKGIWW